MFYKWNINDTPMFYTLINHSTSASIFYYKNIDDAPMFYILINSSTNASLFQYKNIDYVMLFYAKVNLITSASLFQYKNTDTMFQYKNINVTVIKYEHQIFLNFQKEKKKKKDNLWFERISQQLGQFKKKSMADVIIFSRGTD